MKRTRKFFTAFILAVLLITSAFLPAVAESISVRELIHGSTDVEIKNFKRYTVDAEELHFTDVKLKAWYHDAVQYLYYNEIVNGVTETEFKPNDNITRAQLVTMLCRAFEIEEEFGDDNFSDCKNKWYSGYVYAAKKHGIANGVGDNKFAPEAPVKHEEAIKLVIGCVALAGDRYYEANFPEPTEEYYKSEGISSWATEYVRVAKIAGFDLDRFKPQKEASRAQVALFLYDALTIARDIM